MRLFEHSFRVGGQGAGKRLDRLLSEGWPQISRAVWQRRIEAGEVLVNQKASKPSRRLRAGEEILFRFYRAEEPPVQKDYFFLYGLDPKDSLVVLAKPPDLPVHPSGVYFENTLTELLKKDARVDFPVHLINRIDRETSGIVLLARDKSTAARMQKILAEPAATKEYRVFVEGSFPNYLDAKGTIGRHKKSVVRKQMHFCLHNSKKSFENKSSFMKKGAVAMQDLLDAKACRTEFWKLREGRLSDGSVVSDLRARIHTGRTHQIRATLHSLGFPVLGDRLYGVDSSLFLRMIRDEETPEDRRRLRIARTALHSWRLSCPHPESNVNITIECPLPKDLLDVWKKIEEAKNTATAWPAHKL